MSSRITFNINGAAPRNWPALLDWYKAARPRAAFIMDHMDRARELKDIGIPIVGHRVYDPFHMAGSMGPTFDADFHRYVSPESVVLWLKQHAGHMKDIYHTVGYNEPSRHQTDEQLRSMLNWFIRLMDLSRDAGFRMFIGEFAIAKSLEKEDVERGLWDEFLRAIDRHYGWHLLTIHSYTVGPPYAPFLSDYPANLMYPDKMHLSQAAYAHIPFTRINGFLPDNWHLGREAWLMIQAKALGLKFDYAITESIYDQMMDINQQKKSPEGDIVYVMDYLKAKYGINLYNRDIRGVNAQRNLLASSIYRQSLRDDEFSWLIYKHLSWFDDELPEECRFIALFAHNTNWDIPEGHDYSIAALDPLRTILITHHSKGEPELDPIVFPASGGVTGWVEPTGDNTNIRHDDGNGNYSFLNNIRDNITERMTAIVFPNFTPVSRDGYMWFPVILNGQKAWATTRFAKYGVTVTPEPEPEPEPVHPLDQYLRGLDADELRLLADYADWLTNAPNCPPTIRNLFADLSSKATEHANKSA